MLLYAPRSDDLNRSPVQDGGEAGNVLRLSASDVFEDRWIDLGFWVDPEGRVEGIDILRSRGNTVWTGGLLRSIAGRRYTPTREGAYRIERYTYTSFWERLTGTRLRQRSADARIEYMDLTADPEAAKQ